MAREADPALAIYLKQIHQFDLLTAAQELDLGRRIKQGDAEARTTMIRANLRLVVNMARNFIGRGLGLADLIEEGNLGLLRAVDGFDPDQGCRFSTYASWWIRQSIRRALIDSIRMIHVPAYMVELIAKWKNVQAQLMVTLGRPPLPEEIAEALRLEPQRVALIRRAVRAVTSADQPIAADSRFTLSEMIEDHRDAKPEDRFFDRQETQAIDRLLSAIDEREAEVLRLRFGIEERGPMTLKDVGATLGLTRERVRQIEKEALRKLASILAHSTRRGTTTRTPKSPQRARRTHRTH